MTVLVQPSIQLGSFPIFVAATQLPGMLDEFVGGLLLARFVRSDLGNQLLKNRTFKITLFGVTIFLVSLALSIYWKYATYWNYPLMVIFWRSLLALAFSFGVLFLMSIQVSGLLRTILSPIFYLGTISYGIYLWHLPILLSLKKITWLDPSLSLILVIILTCIFASISWHFFEHPIIERLKLKSNATYVI